MRKVMANGLVVLERLCVCVCTGSEGGWKRSGLLQIKMAKMIEFL